MMRRVPIAIVFYVLGATLACNGGGGDDGDSPEPDVEGFVDDVVAAQCERIFSCCDPGEFDTVFAGTSVEDRADCREALSSRARVFFVPAIRDAVESDRVTFHEGATDTCVENIETTACEEFEPRLDLSLLRTSCTRAVEPALTLSNFCSRDFECETGFCSQSAGAAEGACKTPPAEGEPCLGGRCGEDLRCTMDDVCADRLAEGEACDRSADCHSDNCVEDDLGNFVCADAREVCRE